MGESWTGTRRALIGAVLALVAGLAAPAALAADTVTVFAASSLTDALKAIGAQYAAETGRQVRFSFGASSAIARQIESGAPAQLFFSADADWMDYLQQRSLIRSETRRNLLGNRLVLIAPSDSALRLKIAPGFALTAALHGGRLATGDPDSVPVGRYAKSALTSLGVWNDVADHIVRAENVRAAMLFVDRGEAPLGIVYQSDAMIDPRVRVVDAFPTRSHPPIVYPAALTRSGGAAAQAFLDYVRGPRGQAIFRKYGFVIL
jgi:molybdate transport system substrate-binding protein